MCGEVPKGHYSVEVVVHLDANQTRVKVPLSRKLEYVKEVRLTEFQIGTPNATGLYRLGFGSRLQPRLVTNAIGEGFCIAVDNTTTVHTVFTNPRVVSVERLGQVLELDITLTNVTNFTQVLPTFTDATFWLTFICEEPMWNADLVIQKDLQLAQNAAGQFSTRAPFF